MLSQFVLNYASADIAGANDWLPEAHLEQWLYQGSPERPNVGSNYLMHLWQNPDHANAHLYQSRGRFMSLKADLLYGSITGLWSKLSINTGQQGGPEPPPLMLSPSEQETRSADPILAVEATPEARKTIGRTSEAVDSDLELQMGEELRSCYVFSRTPKKKGAKLEPDDRYPPEGLGMHFEEGFRVHHLFILLLFFYVLGSLAFGIFWYRQYGMTGPQSGLGSFEVSSWMIGLISLVTTVWLKWAD